MKDSGRTIWGAAVAFGLGLLASGVALILAAGFSMGFALEEPWVVWPILVGGPALSVTAWAVLSAGSGHAGPGTPDDVRLVRSPASDRSRPRFLTPAPKASPSLILGKFFGGVFASVFVFFVVCAVESLSPGERRSDVFGPYYTHPYRPLAGVVLALFGLSAGGYLYYQQVMRHVAAGFAVGCVVLGLFLVFAF